LHDLHVRGLVPRQDLGEHGLDAELGGDGGGHRASVAGHHDHLDALLLQAPHRLARLLPHGIRDREHRERGGLLQHRDGGLPACRRPLHGRPERPGRLHAEAAQQHRPRAA
jgi:hypothetical protein